MGAYVRFDIGRFNAAARDLLRRAMPAAVDQSLRWGAFAVVGEIARSLNGEEAGFDVPKRIDTGRYRAAWSVTTRAVFGKAAGPTSVGTSRSGEVNPPRASDGTGKLSGSPLGRRVMLENNVEYGHEVEYGTRRMRPGRHARRAIEVVRPRYRLAVLRILRGATRSR